MRHRAQDKDKQDGQGFAFKRRSLFNGSCDADFSYAVVGLFLMPGNGALMSCADGAGDEMASVVNG